MTNEEALASHLSPARRRETGAFFTPRALVERVLDLVAPWLPEAGPDVVVDPACGAGAFLVAARERHPRARLVGAEVDQDSAATARARVPDAEVVVGDALGSDALVAHLGPGFELWVGNPPYNGTSPLLRDKRAWARACAWLPPAFALQPGTSLREDYVFFLLRAARRLEARPGALAFITSSTLLDTFSYAPVRAALLQALQLRTVLDLGAGAFTGTRVRTCVTVWTAQRDRRAPRFAKEGAAPVSFVPEAPTFALRPKDPGADELEARWRSEGAALTELVPVSFPGLKTRFDELLVDDDPARLLERVEAFLRAGDVAAFARRFGLKASLVPKLEALHAAATGVAVDPGLVRPFLRYRGARPLGAPAFCYLDRRLIPRGDHRLRGGYDPHREPVKLVFNQHELPLAATVLDQPGCVTAYRHARFAPLMVPRALLEDPLTNRLTGQEPLAPNLGPLGLAWARALGSPRAVFEHLARHVMSAPFQDVWAPARGTSAPPLIAPPQM